MHATPCMYNWKCCRGAAAWFNWKLAALNAELNLLEVKRLIVFFQGGESVGHA